MIISRSVLRRMRNILDKNCREKHILCSVTFFPPKITPFWDNVEKYCRARSVTDNVIQRMRIACWIPKAANTHSTYVILTAFPLQQCLQERVSVLRYTCFAFFGSVCNRMHVQIVISVFEAGERSVWTDGLSSWTYIGIPVSQCSLSVFRVQATDAIIRQGFACWIPKTINTHSECVILLAYGGNNGHESAPQFYFIRLLPVLSLPWCRCGVINTAWHSALRLTWQVFMFSYVSSVIYSDCTAVYGPTASFRSVSLNQRFAIFLRRPPKYSYLEETKTKQRGSW